MRVAAAVLGLFVGVVCSGCGFNSNRIQNDGAVPDAATDGVPTDGALLDAPDAPPVLADGCVTFSQRVNTCQFSFTGDLTVPEDAVYNTDTHQLMIDGDVVAVARATFHTFAVPGDPGNDVDAILVHDLTIRNGVTLRAVGNTGSMALAILASGRVTLENDARIDVSNGGAGALAACSTPPMAGEDNVQGSGGGGGGAYGSGGGGGGAGNAGAQQADGGRGGGSVALPPGLRGGCPGERGGLGKGNGFAVGGNGGGAIFIAAAGEIRFGNTSIVNAGGGGGQGGPQNSGDIGNAGGGGGGSGGMIVLEAPRVVGATARIVANGGGGGEGSSVSESGNPGTAGLVTSLPAAGGLAGPADGGDGGAGGALGGVGGLGGLAAQRGGGGGGGSVGYIHIVSADPQVGTAVLSPAPTITVR